MYVYIRIDTNNFEIGRAADDALARNDKQQTGRRFASKMDGIEASAQRMVVYARIYNGLFKFECEFGPRGMLAGVVVYKQQGALRQNLIVVIVRMDMSIMCFGGGARWSMGCCKILNVSKRYSSASALAARMCSG